MRIKIRLLTSAARSLESAFAAYWLTREFVKMREIRVKLRPEAQYYWETMEASVRSESILEAMRNSGLREANCNTQFGVFKEYTAVKS